MTAQQKAAEIVAKLGAKGYLNKAQIKEMAQMIVAEVVAEWEYIDTYLGDGKGALNPSLMYWLEVQKIIINL